MSNDHNDASNRKIKRLRKPSNFKPESVGDYENGYGKPPEHGKIAKGERRNPNGRPKGARNRPRPISEFAKMVLAEGNRTVSITEGGKRKSVRMNRAIVRRRAKEGLEKGGRAASDHLKLQMAAERELRAEQESAFKSICDYKMRCLAELREREEQGVEPPQLLPHPDHIRLNFADKTYTIAGPSNFAQKKNIENVFCLIEWLQYEIWVGFQDWREEIDPAKRDLIVQHLDHTLQGFVRLWRAIGFPWPTKPPRKFPDFDPS